jgi:chromate transporter
MGAGSALLLSASLPHWLGSLDHCGWLDPPWLPLTPSWQTSSLDLPLAVAGQALASWLQPLGPDRVAAPAAIIEVATSSAATAAAATMAPATALAAAGGGVAAGCQPASLGDWQNLVAVIRDFLSLSLFSFGGGNTLLNEYHEMAVSQYCWLSSRQFADLYAIAEAAPGPSSMIVGLLGMAAAVKEGPLWGLLSGMAAELAILLPSTLLMVAASLSWNRLRDSPWRVAFERAMGPITLGILWAVGLKILRISNHDLPGYAVSFLVCWLMLNTRLSPLWFMAVAGGLGALGLVNH